MGTSSQALPAARGPLSAELLIAVQSAPAPAPELLVRARAVAATAIDSLTHDDLQLALTVGYELHYQGLPGVDERWEWHPDLLAAMAELEAVFERDLRGLAGPALPSQPVAAADIPDALAQLTNADTGPSLSKHLARRGTRQHYVEFATHRSIYHLKEADPHTWAIPRLSGKPKAALVEIQSDEYGGGRADWMHATLFADTMRGLGLDDTYGHYIDDVPAITLAWANTMSLFGLHRRLRGAAIGHLAALEMTSSLPNRRYGNGLRRLGFDADTTRFFDEHIEADAVHEQIAAHDLAGQLALAEPRLVPDLLFGAAAALQIDSLVAARMFTAWEAGQSSLRGPADTVRRPPAQADRSSVA